ncbi:MAG: hypothetical protein HYY49_03080 [Ignavibacteriales bacterium]|nr:hypothetical protein [Ignavibacteriales bacterium]
MIVTKPIFRLLKKRNPRLIIGVVTSPSNSEIIKNDRNVDKRYVLYANPLKLFKELVGARKSKYDVVVNFIFNRTTSAALIANFICPKGIKVGQGAKKYEFYFNTMVELPRSELHMVEILAYYVANVFQVHIGEEELDLYFDIDEKSREAVERSFREQDAAVLAGRNRRFLVFNISAREPVKRISIDQAVTVARYLTQERELYTVLICAPEDFEMTRMVADTVRSSRCLMFPQSGSAPLIHIAALLEKALCVITPDTSIVHLASAVKTPVLAFFTPLLSNREWMPFRVAHDILIANEGKPVSSISASELKRGINEFLSKVEFGIDQEERV